MKQMPACPLTPPHRLAPKALSLAIHRPAPVTSMSSAPRPRALVGFHTMAPLDGESPAMPGALTAPGPAASQSGAAGGPGRPAQRVEAGGRDVDGAVIRRPGRGLDVERLTVDAGPVELRRCPRGHRRAGAGQVEHEDLLPVLAADRGEDALDQVEVRAVAQLLVVSPGRLAAAVVPGD